MSDALADPLTTPAEEDETKLQGDNPSEDEVIGREGSDETPEVETVPPIEPPDIVPDDQPPSPPAIEEPGPKPAADTEPPAIEEPVSAEEEQTIVGPSDGLSDEEREALEESNREVERLEAADIEKDEIRAQEEEAERLQGEADQKAEDERRAVEAVSEVPLTEDEPEPGLEPDGPVPPVEETPEPEDDEDDPEAAVSVDPEPSGDAEEPVSKPTNPKNRIYLVFEESRRNGRKSYALVPECLYPDGSRKETGEIESRNADNALRAAYRRLVEVREDDDLIVTLDIRTASGFKPRRIKPRARNLPPALEID